MYGSDKMKCIYHALKMFKERGGYIFIRTSHYNKKIPHFGWAKGITEGEHWQPDHPLTGWKVLIHMFFAKGKVKKGD